MAAKKKVAAKKKAAKKKVSKKPPAPAPEVPSARGQVGSADWSWFGDGPGGRLEASSESGFSFEVDFGLPLGSVEASLNGEAMAPKVEGSVVRVRCLPGRLIIKVNWSDPPEPAPVVSHWV